MNKFQKMNKILSELDELPIYIAGHIKPDQDSICSCLALAEFLKNKGKTVYVLINKADESIIDWQGKSDFIVNEIKDKNYNFIALDLNEMKRLGDFYEGFKSAKFTINIDHHQDNLFEANETLSIPGISSTCEMIFEIIKNS